VKYAFMNEYQAHYKISAMCRVFDVSRSGYYEWLTRDPSEHKKEDDRLRAIIKESFEQSRQTYGSRRVQSDLSEQGNSVSRQRIARLMKEENLQVKTKKKFRVTTDSKHHLPVATNLLNREFSVDEPNKVYTGDITYVWTEEGWLFLAVVLDLFSRYVVGWSMSARMKAALVCQAMEMACQRRSSRGEIIAHSDRGSQYASEEYQNLLKDNAMVCSMSRKGNCWDNAPTESFFHTLKTELIHHRKFATRQEAMDAIFEYIEVFYNRQRKHSTLDYRSSEAYEAQHYEAA